MLIDLNYSKKDGKSYVQSCFEAEIPTVAVSEYQKLYAEQIRKYIKGEYCCLGTDGFGRSDTREKLREYFQIDSNHIVIFSTKNSRIAQ